MFGRYMRIEKPQNTMFCWQFGFHDLLYYQGLPLSYIKRLSKIIRLEQSESIGFWVYSDCFLWMLHSILMIENGWIKVWIVGEFFCLTFITKFLCAPHPTACPKKNWSIIVQTAPGYPSRLSDSNWPPASCHEQTKRSESLLQKLSTGHVWWVTLIANHGKCWFL